jgi:hypothetical protein
VAWRRHLAQGRIPIGPRLIVRKGRRDVTHFRLQGESKTFMGMVLLPTSLLPTEIAELQRKILRKQKFNSILSEWFAHLAWSFLQQVFRTKKNKISPWN